MLQCMGREIANVHLGSPDRIAAVKADLKRRKPGWLQAAAQVMAEATLHDWRAWRRG